MKCTMSVNQFFNTFDRFGYLLGLERIPKENNIDYKRRLLDVYRHRSARLRTCEKKQARLSVEDRACCELGEKT